MKNILAENMLRFGVKNLSESATKRVKILAEAPENVNSVKPAGKTYPSVSNDQTISKFENILTQGGTVYGTYRLNLEPADEYTSAASYQPKDYDFICTNISIAPKIFDEANNSLLAVNKTWKTDKADAITYRKYTHPDNPGLNPNIQHYLGQVLSNKPQIFMLYGDLQPGEYVAGLAKDFREITGIQAMGGNADIFAFQLIQRLVSMIDNLGLYSNEKFPVWIDRIMTNLAGAGIYKEGTWNQAAVTQLFGLISKGIKDTGGGNAIGVKKLATYKQGSFAVPQ